MLRRVFLRRLVLVTAGLAAGKATADSVDDIIEEIRSQGFSIVRVQRTWLGRVQIVGQNASFRREVVIDPTTGEIRRDLLVPRKTRVPADPGTEPELGSPRGIEPIEGEPEDESEKSPSSGTSGGESGWGGGWGSQDQPAGSAGEDDGGADAR
jgi:hypothetical protein